MYNKSKISKFEIRLSMLTEQIFYMAETVLIAADYINPYMMVLRNEGVNI